LVLPLIPVDPFIAASSQFFCGRRPASVGVSFSRVNSKRSPAQSSSYCPTNQVNLPLIGCPASCRLVDRVADREKGIALRLDSVSEGTKGLHRD